MYMKTVRLSRDASSGMKAEFSLKKRLSRVKYDRYLDNRLVIWDDNEHHLLTALPKGLGYPARTLSGPGRHIFTFFP